MPSILEPNAPTPLTGFESLVANVLNPALVALGLLRPLNRTKPEKVVEELPEGWYRTILIDPPWKYPTSLPGFGVKTGEEWKRPGSVVPYPTMTIEEIKDLPVGKLAAPDAYCFLWTTNTHIWEARDILKAWGFKPSIILHWAKKPQGSKGFPTFGILTEYLIFARRGTLPARARFDRNWWELKRGKHSKKPDEFYDLIEAVSHDRMIEIFAREARPGWAALGNEIDGLDIRAAIEKAIEGREALPKKATK